MKGAWYSPLAFLYPRNIHRIPTENIELIVLENIIARSDERSGVWLQLSVKKHTHTENKDKGELKKTESPPSREHGVFFVSPQAPTAH